MEGCDICPGLAKGIENVGVRSVLMGGQGKVSSGSSKVGFQPEQK